MQKLKKRWPRATAILLALMMVVVFIPTFAFAGNDSGSSTQFSISTSSEGVTEIGTYGSDPAYYVVAPEGTETLLFSDIPEEDMEYAMIISNDGMQMLEETNTAPLSDAWRIGESDASSKITLKDGVDAPDYSNAYFYFVNGLGEDSDSAAFIVSLGTPEEVPTITFEAKANWSTLASSETTTPVAKGYTYHDYYGSDQIVDLYTVKLPLGVSKVDLSFSDKVLAYNYLPDGITYVAGAVDDPYTGVDSITVDVNANAKTVGSGQYAVPADNEFDVIQIQTPYKGTSSTLLYALTFEYDTTATVDTYISRAAIKQGTRAKLPENYTWTSYPDSITPGTVAEGLASYTDPAVGVKAENIKVNINTQAAFTATVGSTKMKNVSVKKSAYKVKDLGLSPYSVDVYTVQIPYDTKKVKLAFDKNVLVYNYSSKGEYLAGYYDNYQVGAKAATVAVNANEKKIETAYGTIPADKAIDYIYVQSPYDSNYNSTLQYVLTFKYVATKVQPMTVKAKIAKIKYKKLKKKNQSLGVGKVLTVKKAQGKVTYKKLKGNKKITINKKTGKVTVKKKLKKGTYKVRVKVSAAGKRAFKAGSKTVTFKIQVK